MNDQETTEKPPVTLTEREEKALEKLYERHSKIQHIGHAGGLIERLHEVVNTYHDWASDCLSRSAQFRDRMLIDFRAISLILTTTINGATHNQKEVRLNGLIELIENAIDRLQKEEFEASICCRPMWNDPFQSNAPNRHFVQRIHELEEENKQLKSTLV